MPLFKSNFPPVFIYKSHQGHVRFGGTQGWESWGHPGWVVAEPGIPPFQLRPLGCRKSLSSLHLIGDDFYAFHKFCSLFNELRHVVLSKP